MNDHRILRACLAALVLSVLPAAAENTWYVSPDGDNGAAGTEAAPFRTIQHAVGRANVNDTIVLLPGDYGADQGTTNTTVSGNSSANRVVVDKPLTIIGRDGRDKTRIVGAWDTAEYADLPYGFGPDAVRCVWIAAAGSGTRLEGITFQDGSVPLFNVQGNDIGGGGGVVVYDSATSATIVDCAVVNCQGFSGGGICSTYANGARLKVVRTLFKRCRGANFGQALRGGGAYNCVFDDNGYTCSKDGTTKTTNNCFRAGAFSYGYAAINCTFVNNKSYGVGGDSVFSGGVYNCLFQKNGGDKNYAINTEKVTGPKANNVTGNKNLYTKFEVVSPCDGDYRLAYNAAALNAGDVSKVASIPEGFRDKDYCGNPLPASGAIHAGAVQEALSGAASGVYIANGTGDGSGTWLLGGAEVALVNGTWKGAEGWPVAFQMKFVPVEGRALVNYSMGGAPYWPLPDDTIWLTARRNQVQGVSPVTTGNIFYADPVNGSDDTGDGSEATPYKTLNKAVKKTTATFVVRALPGDYNEGGENVGDDITTRVVVPKALEGSLRVIAVDGPESTFISGASDPDTSDGTGANAVRCIAVVSTNAYRAAFQGFTLRDGRSGPNSTVRSIGAALCNSDMGDANFASFNTAYLLDCVVTNCSGNRAGCIAGGNAYRCKFYDCKTFGSSGQCDLRYCNIVSSLFVGCGGKSQVFGNTAKGYNCTIYGSVGDTPQSVYNNGSGVKGYLYNCVSGRPSDNDIHGDTTDDQLVYTLYCRMSANSNTFTTAEKEEPLKLLGAASGDYRLAPDSAGVWLASTSYMQSCMDIDGNPFVFDTAAGRYQAGCYALRVGGTLYVDATNGGDANDGASESDAFKTLAAAMAAADYGDTVIALPGTYEEGTMVPTLAQSCYTNAPTLPARVVVKGGVTLESRDGPEETIIKGEAAETDDGCGDGAVRGVFLCAGATLRGFTVANGHTLRLNSGTIDVTGGGICGPYSASDGDASQWRGLVENCIITGCSARNGGGAQYGTYRNCRFEDNAVYNYFGVALSRGLAEGCVFKGNGPSDGSGHSVCYDCKIVNCTLFGGQAGAKKANTRGLVFNEGTAKNLPVLNSIVLGNYATGASTNNFFLSGALNTSGVTSKYESGNVTGGASVVDGNGVPVSGSAVIDAGDASFCSAECLAGRDLAGTRRILNSTIDIGAFEYDWGRPWGNAIGGRRLAIDDMPSDAALGADGKSLVFGAPAIGEAGVPVAMSWTGNGNGASYDFTATVTGAGTLVVTANGAEIATLTAADGAKALKFTSALASNSLLFAYDGPEADGVTLSGFSNQAPFVLMVR